MHWFLLKFRTKVFFAVFLNFVCGNGLTRVKTIAPLQISDSFKQCESLCNLKVESTLCQPQPAVAALPRESEGVMDGSGCTAAKRLNV